MKEVPSSYKILSELSFCTIDLETTGGNLSEDNIIEIGLVKIKGLKIRKELSFLVRPEVEIPQFIQKLTSLNKKSLKNSPVISEVIEDILGFIGDSILVAHNASFDIPFFNSVLTRLNRSPLKNPSICTNLMTKFIIPEMMNSNLTYLGKLFGIPYEKAHRALEDARVTSHLLLIYLNFFISRNIKKVNHLYYPHKKYGLDEFHLTNDVDGIEKILSIANQHSSSMLLTFKNEKGTIADLKIIAHQQGQTKFINKLLTTKKWKTVTVKLLGPFLKAFLQLNILFPRLDLKDQTEVIDHLYSSYLSDFKKNESSHRNLSNYFLIIPHLIHDQFQILSLNTSSNKKELIFRYPLHQKKLFNFININIKMANSDKKSTKIKNNITPVLVPFFWNFINKVKEEKHPEYFFFSHDYFKKNLSHFKTILKKFLDENEKLYNFPKEHL